MTKFQGFSLMLNAKCPVFQKCGYRPTLGYNVESNRVEVPKRIIIHGKSRRISTPLASLTAHTYDSQPSTALCTCMKD